MKRYKVEGGVLRLFEGTIFLSGDQIAARRRVLDVLETKSGRCKIKGPLMLKSGETCGFDGAPPKSAGMLLIDLDAEPEPSEEGEADDLEGLSWQKLKERVENAGGNWTNRTDALEFLSGI